MHIAPIPTQLIRNRPRPCFLQKDQALSEPSLIPRLYRPMATPDKPDAA